MDEKELVKKTRNSIKAGKGRAEIMESFQKRGFKLKYADAIIKKARKPRSTGILIGLFLLVGLFSFGGGYFLFGTESSNKPLVRPEIETEKNSFLAEGEEMLIEPTPELITYILEALGARELHKAPFTFEKPYMGFIVGEEEFYSVTSGEIETFRGTHKDLDISIQVNQKAFSKIVLSENPKESLSEHVSQGEVKLEVFAGEVELFSKGYLSLYESLQ